MAFKQRSSGPFKMMGSSPARNGQATKGKLKKTFTGPIKPMVDKDGDGIPIGVDIKDTPGGKQSTPPKQDPKRGEVKKTKLPKKKKPVTNTQKQSFNYDPIPSVKDNA